MSGRSWSICRPPGCLEILHTGKNAEMPHGLTSPAGVVASVLLLASFSFSCTSGGPTASGTDALSAHGLAACSPLPLLGQGASNPDSVGSTPASLLADMHPDLFAGLWWDGVAGQIVFDTVDVPAATAMIDSGLAAGTSFRVEHVERSFTELRVLMDRAMSVDDPGSSRSVARGWDSTVDVGIPRSTKPCSPQSRKSSTRTDDAICVSVVGPTN